MTFLLDTNVLLRLEDAANAQHQNVKAAIGQLDADGHECVIVPQILYEFWVVATRPVELNGLGMAVADVEAAIAEWTTELRLLLDDRGIYSRWLSLVVTHEVKGKLAHDARLVAAMQRHGLKHLLTVNKADFVRFPGLKVFTPTEILSGAALE